MENTINNLISHLNVSQKIYRKFETVIPDLKLYPVEFPYLVRCLHTLGDDFVGYMIKDIVNPTLTNAIYYCIKNEFLDLPDTEINNLLAYVNCFIVSNDNLYNHIITENLIINTTNCKEFIKTTNLENIDVITHIIDFNDIKIPNMFVVIYKSLSNNYYPVVSIVPKTNYLFHKNNKLIQKLLVKLILQ